MTDNGRSHDVQLIRRVFFWLFERLHVTEDRAFTGASVIEDQADVESLRPEVAGLAEKRRILWITAQHRRQIVRIHPQIDLTSGPLHVSPVQERVADEDLQLVCDPVSQ